jgi:hypothetical protein
MAPVIGLLARGQVLLNRNGRIDLEAYLNRVADVGRWHGCSPAGVTMSPRLLESSGRDRGEVEAVRQQLNDLNLRCTASVGSLLLHAKDHIV